MQAIKNELFYLESQNFDQIYQTFDWHLDQKVNISPELWSWCDDKELSKLNGLRQRALQLSLKDYVTDNLPMDYWQGKVGKI